MATYSMLHLALMKESEPGHAVAVAAMRVVATMSFMLREGVIGCLVFG